jgi:hypothetical protein
MYVLIKSDYGQLLGDCEVLGTYETLKDAEKAFAKELWLDAMECGCDEDGVHTELCADGLPSGEHDRSEAQWRVFEAQDPTTPKRNPNVAETVSYECKNDPTFRSREVLLHQATVRWNSGKSFECHAPERVELRIGGTSYEYKAV